jgi:tetratricopeptide (TPR) repeat protein
VTIQVFVSYRRGDSPHAAGRLVDRLNEHFELYIDVDRVRPGVDFTVAVREAVDRTDVLVAVIGLQWLTLTAENGGRRIDQPGDWVAEEIGTALGRGTPVIPVLIDGANMPSRQELPPALAALANRQALRIAYESFAADSARLIQAIESTVSRPNPKTVNLWEDPDYPEARAAFLQGLWPASIEGFERVLQRHPRHVHVGDQLNEAKRRQQLLDLDADAKEAADAGRWQEAVDALTKIDELQPSDDVKERLAQAQLMLRINELQNDIRAFAKTGTWKAVLAADAELTRLDPEAGDPDGLASKARAELLEAELAASYAKGVKQLDEHDWSGAEATFRALLERRASYRDAEGLLALARRQGRPEEKHEPSPKPPANKPVPAVSALPREEVGRQATPNPKASVGAGPPPLVIHQVEDLGGKAGRLATPAVQRRQESRKSGRWTIWLTLAAFLVVGSIATIALVNNGDQSNTNSLQPSISSQGRPEDYNKLLSHLPPSERSTCRPGEVSGASPEGSLLAVAYCSAGGYDLWKDIMVYFPVKEGDCLHSLPDDDGVYQLWAERGMSGKLACSHTPGDYYVVYWSIDQLEMVGTFISCVGCSPALKDYQETVSEALKIRDEVE